MTSIATSEARTDGLAIRAPHRLFFLCGIANAAVPLMTVMLWLVVEAAWVALLPFLWSFVTVPILDAIIGEDETNPPEDGIAALQQQRFYTWIVYAQIPVLLTSFVAGMWLLTHAALPIWALIPFLYTLGVGSGHAIIVAHELGHRTGRTDRMMAQIALGIVGYGHFCIEHNRGHHVRVATPEDCSSARYGETVYAFAWRDITGALLGGWKEERRRLKARGHGFFSAKNEVLQSYALTVLAAALLVLWLGWAVLPFLLIHHVLAYFALSMVNYIEHYGLKRRKLPSGRYEPCQPKHSWNTNHAVSNILEINLQRHSDHHANPQRPYQCLRNFEELPRLPSGYPGCLSLSLIPPLWFAVMNPRVRDWAGGDFGLINTGPEDARAPELVS
ncbi:MAG: alkane 1-monooxygenase [Parvularcula sp.]|nr:alkane 1-monooxygenase [Parvularcula sp.]